MLDRRPFWCLIIWLNLCVVIWLVMVQESVMPDASLGPNLEQLQQRQIQQQQQQQQQQQPIYAGHGKHLLEAHRMQTNHNNNNNNNFNIDNNSNSLELTYVGLDSNNAGPTTTISLVSNYGNGNGNSNNNNNNNNDSNSRHKYQIPRNASRDVLRLNRHSNKTNLVIEPNNNNNNVNNNYNYQQQQQRHASTTTTTTTKRPHYNNNAYEIAATPSLSTTPRGAAAAAAAASAMSGAGSFSISDDEQQLIDLHDFTYLMTQPACEAQTTALIVVHTAPHNYEKRQLIRQTWASDDVVAQGPLRVLFLLGAVEENHTLQGQLIDENAIYADMVQGSFNDDYRNMTYKHVMALKWFRYNCAHAQLLVKADDDVFVNTPFLRRHLSATAPELLAASASSVNSTKANLIRLLFQPEQAQPTRGLLFCQQFVGARVKRSYRSKWRVSFSEYRERFYPPYCPGYAIVYSSDVVAKLYRAAQQARYFWIDDVMITGVLAQRTNTTITQMQPYVLFSKECTELLAAKTDFDAMEFLFSWHSILPEQMRALWALHEASRHASPSNATTANGAGDRLLAMHTQTEAQAQAQAQLTAR